MPLDEALLSVCDLGLVPRRSPMDFLWDFLWEHTVDGGNPAPVSRWAKSHCNPIIYSVEISSQCLPTGAGFLPSTVWGNM